ncbi:hypothetical protein ACN47E_001102 [Coniothyrium glycines]
MGRQAYLDKIAFGRSAFEPTQSTTSSANYVQLESAQADIPCAYTEATANSYVQLYDERGNPMHPRSNSYGKQLRDAQNDVLASVGVVQRRRLPSTGLPGSYNAHLDVLETEDTAGNVIALTSTIAENLCTWWIGSIRERVLTFRYQDAISISNIIEAERHASGPSLVYAGFAARLFSTMSIQSIVYGTYVYQPIERLIRSTRATPKTRQFFRRWRQTLNASSRLALEILFYPFSYRSSLERLGLVAATSTPLLCGSPFRSSVPLPLSPFSIHHDASASILSFIKAAMTSPVLYVCAEHIIERWVYAHIFEAVDSSILRPDNPDIQSRDAGDKDRTMTLLGLKRQSPPLVRGMVNRLLSILGWGKSFEAASSRLVEVSHSTESLDPLIEQAVHIGGIEITNMTPLNVPRIRAEDQRRQHVSEDNVVSTPNDTIDVMIRPDSPTSPIQVHSHDDNDPRIRITSREGIVEMEVRLPPRVSSSQAEVTSTVPQSGGDQTSTLGQSCSTAETPSHRVTQLSTESSQMIGAIVKAQLVSIAMLPLKMVTLRMIASHYLGVHGKSASRPVMPLSYDNVSWRSLCIQVSRVAMCGTIEVSIDLALWGAQYFAITQIGKSFGWGNL